MTHDPQHHEYRMALGPFVLGQLDGDERARVEAHLSTCEECLAELAELAPVAELLAQASPLASAAPLQPPAELGDRIEHGVRQLAARELRSRWTRIGLAVGGGAVAAGAFFVAGFQAAPDAPPTAAIPLEHVDVRALDRAVDADADIVAHTWGVEVKLHGSGFDLGEAYDVSVISADGEEHPAGEFVGTGDRAMNCNLNSSVLRDDAAGFEVRDATGSVVVTSAF